MNALLSLFRSRAHSFAGCTPLLPSERMARYSLRHAADMRERENAGAAPPRVRVVDGREVVVSLRGRVNHLPNQEPDESPAEYEARMQLLRAQRLAATKDRA